MKLVRRPVGLPAAPFATTLITVVLLIVAVAPWVSIDTRAATPTSGVGGTVSIGTATLSTGKVNIPIVTTAAVDGYAGLNITLTWNASLLSFSSADLSGSTLAALGGYLCLPGPYSGAGGTGELESCSVFSGSTTNAGLLVTFHLNVLATGCSNLHIVTYDVPDNGDTDFGAYTIDAASGSPQSNALGPDIGVDTSTGASCGTPPPPEQTISFGQASKTYGDPDFDLVATASSGLPVTFAISGDCSIVGETVHILSAGSCTAIASQSGDSYWHAAPDVLVVFSINKANQSISFPAPPTVPFDQASTAVSATASSGLPVSIVTLSPLQCSIAGTSVSFVAVGTCTLQANQAGDMNHNPASAQASFSITKGNQTISFEPIPDKVVSEPDFVVAATASSGLPIVWGVSGDCTNPIDATIHLTAVVSGSCTVTAFQLGDSNWNAAPHVTQAFNILPIPCEIDQADINGDGAVNGLDLNALAMWFAQVVPPAPVAVDVNDDGAINGLDLGILAKWFTHSVTECPPTETPTPTPTTIPTATDTPTGLPDLVIQSIFSQAPVWVASGDCAQPGHTAPGYTDVTVANTGAGDAGSFSVDANGMVQTVPGLSTGRTQTLRFNFYLYGEITAVADVYDEVTESSEANNELTIDPSIGGTATSTPSTTPTPTCTVGPTDTWTPTPTPTGTPTP